jgi:hypothetical protein
MCSYDAYGSSYADLGHHTVRWVGSVGVIEDLVLVVAINDSLAALANNGSDLLEKRCKVGLSYV